LAAITQTQSGATINRIGTGRPTNQPAIRTGRRPYRSDRAPATRFVTALVIPKAATKVMATASPSRWKPSRASSGRIVRS
jgi:hypothetical protein